MQDLGRRNACSFIVLFRFVSVDLAQNLNVKTTSKEQSRSTRKKTNKQKKRKNNLHLSVKIRADANICGSEKTKLFVFPFVPLNANLFFGTAGAQGLSQRLPHTPHTPHTPPNHQPPPMFPQMMMDQVGLKGDSARTKEALARMVSNRLHGRVRTCDKFPNRLCGDLLFSAGANCRSFLLQAPGSPEGMRPPVPGSPGGSRPTSPRSHLRNITNNEPKSPRSKVLLFSLKHLSMCVDCSGMRTVEFDRILSHTRCGVLK